MLDEEVHGPVERLDRDLLEPVDRHAAAHPALDGELRARVEGPIGDQGEQDPLDVVAEAAFGQEIAEHLVELQAPPETIEDVGAAEGEAPLGLDLGAQPVEPCLDGGALARLQEAAQARTLGVDASCTMEN